MTRAADRLIICGADGERQRPKGCWYDLVVEPLQPFLVEDNDNGEKVWRFRKEPRLRRLKHRLAHGVGGENTIIGIPVMAAATAC